MAGDRRERRHDGAEMALQGKILKKAMGKWKQSESPSARLWRPL